VIGVVCATEAGRRNAAVLIDALPEIRLYDGPVATAIASAWFECDAVVAFLATGAAVRLVAPMLDDKRTDPGLVCVDEAARYAVAVLGGHEGGANKLAHTVAGVLGARPVVTTASDAVGGTAVDMIVAAVDGVIDPTSDTAAVVRALLDGELVQLRIDIPSPLPALPSNVVEADSPDAPCIVVSDRLDDVPRPAVVIRPRSLIVGIGASRGVESREVRELVAEVLASQRLSPLSVRDIASIDAKSDEIGLLEAIAAEGWHPRWFTSEQLAGIDVPSPSDVVREAVGTPSVAEASAILAAGAGGRLLAGKHKSAMATVAVSRRRARGRLAVIGIGPGARDLMTPRAISELQRASLVVGLDQYVDQVRDLLRPGTAIVTSELGDEEARARAAVSLAAKGNAVAIIGSGDAGVYAMASPALDIADDSIDVVVVPGVTAALAASAAVGSALGHDHCAISLSDLHTPWAVIESRVRAAAEGDFVTCFYNPRSTKRDWQLDKSLAILREHRPRTTPVAIVTNATRDGETTVLTTLDDVDVEQVGMYSIVIVGSSQSRYVAGRFVTPRGYTWAD
jgi:cobalt-precorrin 5A hydrolase/precorrin-3B C17-methyltransferase